MKLNKSHKRRQILYVLAEIWGLNKQTNKPHKQREQVGTFQRWGLWVEERGEGAQKVQASVTRQISSGDIMYNMVIIIKTIVLGSC